jgi:hypothetical protein
VFSSERTGHEVTEYSKRQEQTLARLAEQRDELARLTKASKRVQRKRDEWIVRAVDAGVRPAEVARVAGVSAGRVSQIAPVPKAPEARVYAQKKGGDALCVTDPDTVPTLPATLSPALSGVASTRQRRPYGKATLFVQPGPVAEVLREVAASTSMPAAHDYQVRVFLVGARPSDPAGGATIAEQVRAWALADPGPEWSTESHYLADADLPVLRFRHISSGLRVTIMRAASWWGETDAEVVTCEQAWNGLAAALDQVPAFAGAGLADTPATTGRALWLRTIPEGRNYPVLSDELRELISTTAGQGRIELRPMSSYWSATIPEGKPRDFTYLDGRFMYAALTWGMPVGEPRRWTGAEINGASAREFSEAIRGRGRWRITCKVPAGWAHVGMFMAAADGGGWCYPDKPGQTFTTWADGSEVWAGMEHGWEPEIHEGITWAEGKPLDTWQKALVGVWEQANASQAPAARLAAKAVRSILLYALGAFATRAHPVTRSVPAEQADQVPAGVEVRRVGEALVWTEPGKVSAWTEQTSHPEWSATIWARARTRLLTGRGVGQERVGALHLPADRIVAFATDALYIAGGPPGWADDGKPGRFRVKGTRPGPFDWPATYADLYRLRDEAEAAQ